MIKLSRADKGVLLFAILALIVLYSLTWSDESSSRYVSLYVGDEKRYIIDLYQEKMIEIEGFLGVSKLEIAGGKVRFVESPCTSHFCIRSGWLNQTIGLIACLPNGVSLQFSNPDNVYDGINF